MSHLCKGCAHTIPDGEELEIEACCKKDCDHTDPTKCAKVISYSHKNDDCFEAVSALVVREPRR